MTALACLQFLATALELTVPSYALRLVRRFGAARVGWFLVIAFASLALLHLFGPSRIGAWGPGSGLAINGVYAVASILLLIGMGHLETLWSERQRVERQKQELQTTFEFKAKEQTTDLLQINSGLVQVVEHHELTIQALTQSEQQFRQLFEGNPQPMWVLDLRTGRILTVNAAALRQYGFSATEFLALNARDLLAGGTSAAFERDMAKPCSTPETRGNWRHRRKDHSSLEVEITCLDLKHGEYPARLVLASDVSHRRQRETELCATQKREAFAHLATGAAHHLDGIVAAVEGHVATLLQKPLDPMTMSELQQLSRAVQRGAALSRQLLTFGGQQTIHLEPLDLSALIRFQDRTLRRLLSEGIELQHALATQLPPIIADRRLIEHVITNLVLNARDAMRHGGKLVLETAPARIEDEPAATGPRANANHFVRLTVRDNGCGMSPEVQAHLFEPFFTTRADRQALGLGLASVFGAVQQHGGWIECLSEPGRGTEMSVFLPCADATTAAAVAPPPVHGTILVIEADDAVRGMARHILDSHGYRVIEAMDAGTATLIWEAQPKQIDLVLTSLNLRGGPSARALAKTWRETRPGLKFAFVSDDILDTAAEDPTIFEEGKVLAKPYSVDQLLRTIQACLDPAS